MKSLEEWKKQVEDYLKSGMSQKSWCAACGIPSGTFQYRLKQVRAADGTAIKMSPKFFELKNKSTGIKLRWGSLEIEISPDFDPNTLKRIFLSLDCKER